MAADKSDEPGVLGNLPRSRPGHRSAKRGGGSRTAAITAAGAKAANSGAMAAKSGATAAESGAKRSPKPAAHKPAARKPSPTTARKPSPAAAARKASPTTARKPAAAKQPVAVPPPEPHSTDPLTGAVRLAGKVAEAGLRTAGGLLKRLPGR